MIAIWPAGLPKLTKPSLSQNLSAFMKETVTGVPASLESGREPQLSVP
jgi:hypothetical protein